MALGGVNRASKTMDKMVGRPGAGELNTAVLQLLCGAGVFVLVAFDAFVVDQVRDIQKHFPGVCPAAAYLFIERAEHSVHLHGNRARFGLALSLPRGALAEAGEILLADAIEGHWPLLLAATVVEHHFEVHLRLAAQPLDIGQKLPLVRTD